MKQKKTYKCSNCNNTTEEDLDDLINHPNKPYAILKNLNVKRIGWSAYKNGDRKYYYCLKCRNRCNNG